LGVGPSQAVMFCLKNLNFTLKFFSFLVLPPNFFFFFNFAPQIPNDSLAPLVDTIFYT
jgi:hypothetical protein